MLQQYLPPAVLKHTSATDAKFSDFLQVATTATVYGIETLQVIQKFWQRQCQLQQYLPFTVLKHIYLYSSYIKNELVLQ